MKFILFVFFFVFTVFTSFVYSDESLDSLKIKVELINNLNTTWKASSEFVPADLTFGSYSEENSLDYDDENAILEDIPEEFDTRTSWPECEEITSHIRDQGSCGSSWAVAAASLISDRTCIASEGKTKIIISADELLSCCGITCSFGCENGSPAAAMRYWLSRGLVSGGDYGDKSTCRPYVFPECSHYVNGTRPPCQKTRSSPRCVRRCVNGAEYKKEAYGKKIYSVRDAVESIQTEIMTHGPVEAVFTVYDDFPLYKSGVYKSTSSKALGNQAVKILGWGVENDMPYWLVANSWNNEWGDNGYFKILRGDDHCGIESFIVAGIPLL